MTPAPIVLFAYNRPHHVRKTLESLKCNALAAESDLTIYIDFPKQPTPESEALFQEVFAVASSESWCKTVSIIRREKNLGLASSIIRGVTEQLKTSDTVIVLEDDFLLAPHFLTYMNNALAMYKNDTQVASVHGYCLPVREPLPETYFLRGTDCWGWATWQRAWVHFETDGTLLRKALKEQRMVKALNFDNSYNYYGMLCDQIAGKNNSWAVRWHAHAVLRHMITLHPGKSLVKNIGLDDSGQHSTFDERLEVDLYEGEIRVERQKIKENAEAFNIIKNYYRNNSTLFEKLTLQLDTYR